MNHSATAVRPFGLRFARRPRTHVELDVESIGYDEERQIAVAADGDGWVPLAHHSMAQTLQTSGETPREDEIYDRT
jgi:putative ATP-grasp target RiPP